jgi:hypothetical protein
MAGKYLPEANAAEFKAHRSQFREAGFNSVLNLLASYAG